MNSHENALVQALGKAVAQVESVLLGKSSTIQMAFAGLLAGGHILLDDLPGMGKTTLARTLAHTLGMSFQRAQFTSDLLPADILGVSIFDTLHQHFKFHQGPVFTQALLADEINRASPRTQSALLEAMAEGQVTVDGQTYQLPKPFFVIATQNPVDLSGTFPLPDSQLDRFLIRLELGYPDPQNELLLLNQDGAIEINKDSPSCLTPAQVLELQALVSRVTTAEPLVKYVLALLHATRNHPQIRTGLSPRAGISLLRMARAFALTSGRSYASPEDVQTVFPAVAGHRLVWRSTQDPASQQSLVQGIIKGVAVG